MNAEHIYMGAEESLFQPIAPLETIWKINAEPSNIIRLAEQGMLHIPKGEDLFEEEHSTGQDQSPLNEW